MMAIRLETRDQPWSSKQGRTMSNFTLPAKAALLSVAFREQLRASTRALKGMQAVVGVAFPIAEAILASLATSAGAGANLGWALLAVVGVLHLFLFWLVIGSDKPLSEFLVEFNDLTDALDTAKRDCQANQLASDTFQATADATMTSLVILNDYSSGIPTDLAGWLNAVLYPWVIGRARIFWFLNTDDLYNFAVYRKDSDGKLRMVWRNNDPRIVVENRE
jgi:hypothetical protein